MHVHMCADRSAGWREIFNLRPKLTTRHVPQFWSLALVETSAKWLSIPEHTQDVFTTPKTAFLGNHPPPQIVQQFYELKVWEKRMYCL